MPNAVSEPFRLHAVLPALVHSPPPPLVAADALRNPELITTLCHHDVRNCDWLKLKQHYSTARGDDGKEMTFACRAADSECYVRRYPDLLQGFCGGSLQGCDWFRIVEHWSRVGHTEARVFSCAPPASDPPPPPPPSPPSPPPPRLWSALSPPPPTDAAMPKTYASFDESPADVKASVQAVAPTVLTAAGTGEQETEINVDDDVESRAAAAPSLPFSGPSASTSQSHLPVLRPPEANKDGAEAPGAATGLGRVGSVSILLAGALVFLCAVSRSRGGGEFCRHHLRTRIPHMHLQMHMHVTHVLAYVE